MENNVTFFSRCTSFDAVITTDSCKSFVKWSICSCWENANFSSMFITASCQNWCQSGYIMLWIRKLSLNSKDTHFDVAICSITYYVANILRNGVFAFAHVEQMLNSQQWYLKASCSNLCFFFQIILWNGMLSINSKYFTFWCSHNRWMLKILWETEHLLILRNCSNFNLIF